jgi:hypothetical protein
LGDERDCYRSGVGLFSINFTGRQQCLSGILLRSKDGFDRHRELLAAAFAH